MPKVIPFHPEFPLDPPRADEVHLWLADAASSSSETLAACHALLSSDERRRAARFVRDDSRRDYLMTHALVRLTLAAYVRRMPADLEFQVNDFGKPRLADVTDAPEFNLTHAAGLGAVAVAIGRPVGVDAEPNDRKVHWEGIRTRFAPAERAQLDRVPAYLLRAACVTLWTLKEAYMKARGQGMSIPLDRFSVSLREHGLGPESLVPTDDDPDREWTLRTIRLERHCVSVAAPQAKTTPERVTIREVAYGPEGWTHAERETLR